MEQDVQERPTMRMGVLLNVALRLHIAYFLAEVMANPDDRRFAGKAIPIRNLLIVSGMSLLFPALHLLRKRWGRGPARWDRYPWGIDDLYLSIFWLDMAGNSFDLYDSFYNFDLLPHLQGTGALAVVLEQGFGMRTVPAIGWANLIHGLLELQENVTDAFLGTHNVRGFWDTPRDIAAGAIGTLVYPPLAKLLRSALRRG